MSAPAPHLPLPPTDRVRAPRTGWTRAHWETVADRLLDGLVPYATPGFAQYRLPGRGSWSGVVLDGLEGYARSFLLAAFRIAGARGALDPALTERYAAGLAAGTDPAGTEAWPRITDCSQQMVEAAAIAVALHESRAWLWDKLDPSVRERTVDWLSGFLGARVWDNNWLLFQVVTEQFLASVGAPYEQRDIDNGLDRIEDWYLSDGWYSDGEGRNFDYYNGWALHLYPLFWSRMAPDGGGERAAVHRERLALFLESYQHFFGADGAPVHQGRSLSYRFATLAPVWAGALAEATPLEPGLTRRLASGVLRHFTERGVPDARGLLPLGWYGPFLPSVQPYSGPASPYWAAKGFLGLLLPEDHPVWTATEQPLPVERADTAVALPAPGWLLHGTRHDGIVRLYNHGSDHNHPDDPGAEDDPHYAKLAYSTRTAPESASHAWELCADNHLALLSSDGTASRRTVIRPLHSPAGSAASWHAARVPGDEADSRIETTTLAHGPWEVRVHRLVLSPGATAARLREGGHAVAGETRPEGARGAGWATVSGADGLSSAVVGLYGWDDGTPSVLRNAAANAFGPHSAVPCLTARAPDPGRTHTLVTLVALSGDPIPARALHEAASATAEADGTVTVHMPDGTGLRVPPTGP
ncbi:DUF2264 domain-containing protein [Streptomyces iconiensis]|uniref:DUF2264 domain-containing protein n=1 Tax=Streptomyces iconiensis TaxID=1384038 RepID=A0ABT6ZPC6_9ACTN|nr:DUF2264 domain-containing protein [Streptomyces iconiensis]MDJ1130889.1 DUF2264 domain-containing protein [Streptomyces iconiensis]